MQSVARLQQGAILSVGPMASSCAGGRGPSVLLCALTRAVIAANTSLWSSVLSGNCGRRGDRACEQLKERVYVYMVTQLLSGYVLQLDNIKKERGSVAHRITRTLSLFLSPLLTVSGITHTLPLFLSPLLTVSGITHTLPLFLSPLLTVSGITRTLPLFLSPLLTVSGITHMLPLFLSPLLTVSGITHTLPLSIEWMLWGKRRGGRA